MYTASQRSCGPQHSSRETVLVKRFGRKLRPASRTLIPPKGQLNGSTINVTYDSVDDPDYCEWNFSPLLCWWRGGWIYRDRPSHNSNSCFWDPCHRHVAAVRQPRDHRTKYPIRVDHLSVYETEDSWTTPWTRQTYPSPWRWTTHSMKGQTARITSSMTFSRVRTRKLQCFTSGVMFSTDRLRRSALLWTAMKYALVSVFPYLGTCSMDVNFSGGVIDTWSHRYSELLLCDSSDWPWSDPVVSAQWPPFKAKTHSLSYGTRYVLYLPRTVNATRADSNYILG